MRKEKTYINKLNLALIQILKQEWPQHYPSFIPELVSSSKTSLSLCENNMVILKLLSEEIFDFSSDTMTQEKTRMLKNSLSGEFSEIFKLCSEVLAEAQKPSLIRATLETLLRFLNWIPLGFIFETPLIDLLLTRFLESVEFRNITLRCLAEIALLNVGPEYDPKFRVLFEMVLASVNRMIPPSTDIAAAYPNASESSQELVLNIAIFLANFLSNHLKVVEPPLDPLSGNGAAQEEDAQRQREVLENAHMYLVKISSVPEREVWKVCLEYWIKLVGGLYGEASMTPYSGIAMGDEGGLLMGLSLNPSGSGATGGAGRLALYENVLSPLRALTVSLMPKPQEASVLLRFLFTLYTEQSSRSLSWRTMRVKLSDPSSPIQSPSRCTNPCVSFLSISHI